MKKNKRFLLTLLVAVALIVAACGGGATPAQEQPKAEEPKTEEPKAEEPKAEEPKAEEPKAEEPAAAGEGTFLDWKSVMDLRNTVTEIVHPNNMGNYPDKAGNLQRVFLETAFS